MKSKHCPVFVFMLVLALLLGSFVLLPVKSGAYEKAQIVEQKKQAVIGAFPDTIVEVGTKPVPLPSRRQIIDADKGSSCLLCHRMPYPTAPQKPSPSGGEALSSIQTTAPGGLRLLTSLPYPFNKVAGSWAPDGKQIVYSVSLVQNDWDIWVMDADGRNRHPLLSGPTNDQAPDFSPDGKSIAISVQSIRE